MTLGIAVISHQCVWVCADRRLSSTKHLATKLLRLDTKDSAGILTYAGVGAKLYNPPFELSEWLRRTLREVDANLNETLHLVAEEATRQAIDRLLPDGHVFMYAGFENGVPLIEMISTPGIAFSSIPLGPGRSERITIDNSRRFNRHRIGIERVGSIGRAAIGSGAIHLSRNMFGGIKKHVDRLGKMSGSVDVVSSRLAAAVCSVSRKVPREVSPESICVVVRPDKGGSQRTFDANGKGMGGGGVAAISNGMDITSIAHATMPVVAEFLQQHREATASGTTPPELDTERMNKALQERANDFKRSTKF